MADRLISSDKIADYVCDRCGAVICDRTPTYCVERDFIVACAKEMPEAVVRCKDCEFCKPIGGNENAFYKNCFMHDIAVFDEAYCAWGERKEDAIK